MLELANPRLNRLVWSSRIGGIPLDSADTFAYVIIRGGGCVGWRGVADSRVLRINFRAAGSSPRGYLLIYSAALLRTTTKMQRHRYAAASRVSRYAILHLTPNLGVWSTSLYRNQEFCP
jgi:hypothetical protein